MNVTQLLIRCAEATAGRALDGGRSPSVVVTARFRGLAWGLAAAQHNRLGSLLDLAPLPAGNAALDSLRPFLPPLDFDLDEGAALLPLLRTHDGSQALGPAYERVLAHAFSFAQGVVAHEAGNAARRPAGAFYTPPDLARRTAELALEALCEQRTGRPLAGLDPAGLAALVEGAEVGDISCGGGAFLAAWVEVLRPRLSRAALLRAASGLFGVDVDPLALLAARADLALQLESATWYRQTADRFRCANPLLLPIEDADPVSAFAEGLIFHPDAAPSRPLPCFDVVLGNPPWEKIRLEERAFFRPFVPAITARVKKGPRQEAIAALRQGDPDTWAWYARARDGMAWARDHIRSGHLPHTAVGELDCYALFTELGTQHLRPDGVLALVVKSGLGVTPRYRGFFRHLVEQRRLRGFWDFENRRRIFAIDSRERFAVLLAGQAPDDQVRFAMGLREVAELGVDSLTPVSVELLDTLNPLTGMLPNTSDGDVLGLLGKLAGDNASFDEVYPDARFGRIVHLTAHSAVLHETPAPDRLPVLEGKFFEQYDGRFSGFAGVPSERRYVGKAQAQRVETASKADPTQVPQARYFVEVPAWTRMSRNYTEPWSLMWRNTTSASNRRSCIATLLPHGPGIQSVQLLQLRGSSPERLACLLAVMNALVFDWIIRRKLVGIDLTQKVVRQAPVPAAKRWEEEVDFGAVRAPLARHVSRRVAALLADDARLWPLCDALGSRAPTPDRLACRRELDVLVAWAYGLPPERMAQIAAGFTADLSAEEVLALSAAEGFPSAATGRMGAHGFM